MTYKQIEAIREVRLWIKDIVVPVAAFATSMMLIPEVRQPVINKFKNVKESIDKKVKKN